MERTVLASRLALLDPDEQSSVLAEHMALVDIELAHALKTVFDANESSDPERAISAAVALETVATRVREPAVYALAAWTSGMSALITGQMEYALTQLEEAASLFLGQGRPDTAAATQVSKLYALAMLGRYDEAILCGEGARVVFLEHGDMLSAGKIEQNLGNIFFRRDQYNTAESLYRAAYARFDSLQDQKQLIQIDNCLATTLTAQHRFSEAAALLERALVRSDAEGFLITQAEIECNLGYLHLLQGQYNRALDFLERSRRRFATLAIPHDTVTAEQELADAYLELNLVEEAAAMYTRILPILAELGLQAEQARALANHARASLQLGHRDVSSALLVQARALYAAEGNAIGEAKMQLVEAQIWFEEGDFAAASRAAMNAEEPLLAAHAWGFVLQGRWIRSECARVQGRHSDAETLLATILLDAEREVVPEVAQRCYTSLGLLATAVHDVIAAEACFQRAVSIIEELRAPLPSDEFRTTFLANKLTPYVELVRLCLDDGTVPRIVEALAYVERARSRALVDMLGSVPLHSHPQDAFEVELLAQLEKLRAELNWLYTQMNRPVDGDTSRGGATAATLYASVRERESGVLKLQRNLRLCNTNVAIPLEPLEVSQLQSELGHDTALVEYFSLDGELLAFVLTDEGLAVVRSLGSEQDAYRALDQFRFQISSVQHGTNHMRKHIQQLALRTRHHLGTLYDLLIRPIDKLLGARRMVVVAHAALHYVPFHALYDGHEYVIQRREVTSVPSAGVLRHCLSLPRRSLQRAILLGVPDVQTPEVSNEINAIAPLFPEALTFMEEEATISALREHAPGADILHLACHGHFRSDSPLFSSLRLADGWFTVYDAYKLNLQCELVTLSACETGMSTVTPGDELIGLARGFFSAGAASLLVSLWTADDAATTRLMSLFYSRLANGDNPAAALRYAQCASLTDNEHAFLWAPFVLMGRW